MNLQWSGAVLSVSEAGLETSADRAVLLVDETDCSTSRAVAKVAEIQTRVPDTEAEAIARLEYFAARTYAPATEASRMSGAGAGVTDND